MSFVTTSLSVLYYWCGLISQTLKTFISFLLSDPAQGKRINLFRASNVCGWLGIHTLMIDTMISLFSLYEYLMLAMNVAAKVTQKRLTVQSQNGQKLRSFPKGNREPATGHNGFSAQGVQSSPAVKGAYKHK